MGTVKWMTIFVLLGSCLQDSASQDLVASVFTATSKSVTVAWENQIAATTSCRVSAALLSDPDTIVAFSVFDPQVIMGTVNMLTPNTNYYLSIDVLDVAETVLVTETIGVITAPEVMAPISSVVSKDSTTFEVEFTLVTGATHYIVRIQNSEGFFREDEVPSSPAEIPSLTPYTEYSLSIMAVNRGGRAQPSLSVTAKTVLAPPVLTTSSASTDTIDVSWGAIDQAAKYIVSIHLDSLEDTTEQETTGTSVTISGLEAGQLYVINCWALDAEDVTGETSSEVTQVTIPPTPTVSVSSTVNGDGVTELTVSWTFDPEVWGEITGNVNNVDLSCTSTTGSCVLSPVGCGEQHSIQVIVSNAAGSGAPTDSEVFTSFPCQPGSLEHSEISDGNCQMTWEAVDYAAGYIANVLRSDSTLQECDTASPICSFTCECGYMYLMSVYAYNDAGESTPVKKNFTTLSCCPNDVEISTISTETLQATWTSTRGAVLYQTKATLDSDVIVCNDTAPECALSDLLCDTTYSVVVTPCNDISGCNTECQSHSVTTAPCTPTDVSLTEVDQSTYTVTWTGNNVEADYTASAVSDEGTVTCTSSSTTCDLSSLLCGTIYEVSVKASGDAGESLSSYSQTLETVPCCPETLSVNQATQSMSNVVWSEAKGGSSFVASLTSTNGDARCHTADNECLMGCITCGTSYTVELEVINHRGQKKDCTFEGFSSSACCPTYVRLYRTASVNTLYIYWRNSDSEHDHVAEILDTEYSCNAAAGTSGCDIPDIQCGATYHVVVSPLNAEGEKSLFCPERLYEVSCLDDNIGTVLYRGKRSVE